MDHIHGYWIKGIIYTYLRCVQEYQHKLSQLQSSEVFLPPEVRSNSGSEGSEHVVQIHDGVHKRVQKTHERDVATWEQTTIMTLPGLEHV